MIRLISLQSIYKKFIRIASYFDELLRLVIYLLINIPRIRVYFQRYTVKQFLKNLNSENPESVLFRQNMLMHRKMKSRSDTFRIKPEDHKQIFFSCCRECTMIGREKIALKQDKFVYHSAVQNSHWGFDLNRILPFTALFRQTIHSAVACDFIKNSKIYYHHLLDTYFFYYLVKKYLQDIPMLIFGKLQSWEKDIIYAIDIRSRVRFIPKIFLELKLNKVIFRNEFLAIKGIIGNKKVRDEFVEYIDTIKKYALRQKSRMKKYSTKIFTIRGTHDSRNPTNYHQVMKIFQSFGYDCIDWASMKFIDQVKIAHSAQVMAGVHGSNLVNLIFSPRDAVIFELFPIKHHDVKCYRALCGSLSFKYIRLNGSPDAGQYYIREDQLITQLSLIEKKLK